MNKYEWIKDMDKLISYLQVKIKKTSSLNVKSYSTVHNMLVQAQDLKSRVLQTLNGKTRAPPFAICIGEDPGIGKSVLFQLLVRVFCNVKGYVYDEDLVYHVDPTSDYHDSLENQVVYHFSEPGNVHKNIAKVKGDDRLSELCGIIDGLPKLANMAHLDKKGMTVS